MLKTVESVLAGGRYLPEHLTAENMYPPDAGASFEGLPLLTHRQKEIFEMIERGLTNQQIANVLGISVSTVKFHLTGLFRELNVRTRTECVYVARNRR